MTTQQKQHSRKHVNRGKEAHGNTGREGGKESACSQYVRNEYALHYEEIRLKLTGSPSLEVSTVDGHTTYTNWILEGACFI